MWTIGAHMPKHAASNLKDAEVYINSAAATPNMINDKRIEGGVVKKWSKIQGWKQIDAASQPVYVRCTDVVQPNRVPESAAKRAEMEKLLMQQQEAELAQERKEASWKLPS